MNKIPLSVILYLIAQPNIALAVLNCFILPVSLNFGTINPYDLAYETMNTSISVTCKGTGSNNVSYTLKFNGGNTGDITARRITNTNNVQTLSYLILDNASQSRVLGDGSNGSATFSMSYFLNNASRTDSFTIYGRIPVQAGAISGYYSDTIVVTLTY